MADINIKRYLATVFATAPHVMFSPKKHDRNEAKPRPNSTPYWRNMALAFFLDLRQALVMVEKE